MSWMTDCCIAAQLNKVNPKTRMGDVYLLSKKNSSKRNKEDSEKSKEPNLIVRKAIASFLEKSI